MFSYRHAYHAGNHADVLKHITLISILGYLVQKDTALCAIDTHAGIGQYSLASLESRTSTEAADGVNKLMEWVHTQKPTDIAPAIAEYIALLLRNNRGGDTLRQYPGSPAIMSEILRPSDRLHLCEMNPSDTRSLQQAVADWGVGAPLSKTYQEDGFALLKRLLPPQPRRACVLLDPSYEMKTDYEALEHTVDDALIRFATGVYCIWYPVIGRTQSHDLPKRIKRIAEQHARGWLNVRLNIGRDEEADVGVHLEAQRTATGRHIARAARPKIGLRESGMLIINPPFTLHDALQKSLPQLQAALGRGAGAGFVLEKS